jgi:branched-chain amino acid transport system permease protein
MRDPDPLPDLCHRGHRAEHPDGLLRAGQSLGTGGFMAVGAYHLLQADDGLSGDRHDHDHAPVGGDDGHGGAGLRPAELRIKGFYLAVATLAAQFFLVWLFNKVPWFYNYSASGQINAPERLILGQAVTGPNAEAWAKYLFCLLFLFVLAWVARNLTRGAMGRQWMAIRDMDIAAEIIGVNPLKAKLSAFAVSSFYVGISGALLFTVYLGAVEVGEAYGIQKSFLVLFMIIIGGLGSIFGSFAGAAFMVLLPVALKVLLVDTMGWDTALATHFQFVIVGFLIMFFLIVEPHGLARLWALVKEKLRLWPFPH